MSETTRPSRGAQYPELTEVLRKENQDNVSALSDQARRLLKTLGVESTINGVPAMVTPQFHEFFIDDMPFHARLAQYLDADGIQELPLIVFDETPDIDVVTASSAAMQFRAFGGGVMLQIQNDLDPLVNDERYVMLAKQIVDDIGGQGKEYFASQQEARRAKKSRSQRVLDWIDYYQEHLFIAGGLLGVVALSYVHVPFTNEDAKIGPIPLPQPIELLVDWNNATDHKAQSFTEPSDTAAAIKIGDIYHKIPLLQDYDASGSPSGRYVDGLNGEIDLLSKPGLYVYNVASEKGGSAYEGETEYLGEDGCVTVQGKYTSGSSKIFTQDTFTNQEARYHVQNDSQLEVCIPRELIDEEIELRFGIWQD